MASIRCVYAITQIGGIEINVIINHWAIEFARCHRRKYRDRSRKQEIAHRRDRSKSATHSDQPDCVDGSKNQIAQSTKAAVRRESEVLGEYHTARRIYSAYDRRSRVHPPLNGSHVVSGIFGCTQCSPTSIPESDAYNQIVGVCVVLVHFNHQRTFGNTMAH